MVFIDRKRVVKIWNETIKPGKLQETSSSDIWLKIRVISSGQVWSRRSWDLRIHGWHLVCSSLNFRCCCCFSVLVLSMSRYLWLLSETNGKYNNDDYQNSDEDSRTDVDNYDQCDICVCFHYCYAGWTDHIF